jgi:hypothetical protein
MTKKKARPMMELALAPSGKMYRPTGHAQSVEPVKRTLKWWRFNLRMSQAVCKNPAESTG